MKWVDRYISSVGDRLPAKQRTDIETELRSLILDALEGRTGKTANFSEEDELAVLREFGRPEEVAQRYAPSPRYLIGPRLYPIYLIVLRILVIVSFFGASIGLIVQHVSSGSGVLAILGDVASVLFSALISAVGTTTVIFAIIERFTPREAYEKYEGKEEAWDPSRLPQVPREKRVGIGDSIVALLFAVFALVAVNLLFFNYSSCMDFAVEKQVINREIFTGYLPWWNVVWGLALAQAAALWIQGRWNTFARIRSIAIDIGCIVLLASLASAPLINGQYFTLLGGPELQDSLRIAGEVLPKMLSAIFIGAMLLTVWDLVGQVAAIVKARRR
ncbi:MAG TPA: hypothetical protein VIL27_01245 [Clostridia bacterium]